MTRPARLLELVHLLGGRRGRPVSELAGDLGVSPRTIFRDLAELSMLNIPFVLAEGGYRLMEGATLRPLNLDAHERAILKLALDSAAVRRPRELARRASRLVAKIDAVSPPGPVSEAIVLADRDRTGAVLPDVMTGIEQAIGEHRVAEIDYVSLHSQERATRRLDPWSLFHRGETWYVAGRCHRHEGPRLFRLDRIRSLRLLPEGFEPPTAFEIHKHLENAWDLYQGEESHEIVIIFDPSVAPLIEHGHHHDGEAVEVLADGGVEYRVTLSHLEEIARWLLGFGGAARAIAPAALIDRVRALAAGALASHTTGRKPPKRASRADTKSRKRAV